MEHKLYNAVCIAVVYVQYNTQLLYICYITIPWLDNKCGHGNSF